MDQGFASRTRVRKHAGLLAILGVILSFFVALSPASPALAANGGSASFNGSSQYFNAGASSDFNIGTNDFTVEWWQKAGSQNSSWPRVFAMGAYPSSQLGVSIEGTMMYVWVAGSIATSWNIGTLTNVWEHWAISRASGTVRLFRNGTLLTSGSSSGNISSSSCPLGIGVELSCAGATSTGTFFTGLITNFKLVNGTAIYTSAFTRPTAPASATTNTKLLASFASSGALTNDSSGLGHTLTNVNSVAYSTSNPYDTTAPQAPTLSTATATSTGANLTWVAPSDNGNSAITGYDYQLDGGSWVATGVTGTSYSITGLTGGTTHTVAIRANNAIGSSAASSSLGFTVTLPSQTVTWSPSNTAGTVVAGTLTPNALASTTGNGAITYSVSSAGTTGCTVNASTAVVTYSAAGTCVILASAAATSSYATGSTTVSFVISKSAQTVTWSPTNTSGTVVAGTLTPNALASTSGNGAITYSLSSAGTTGCTVNASTAVITYSAAGTCSILATAASTTAYNSATTTVSFTISTSPQTVTWAPNTSILANASPTTPSVAASALGSATITYAVQSTGTTGCAITNSSTGAFSFTGAGTCVIRATAAATAAYATSYLDVAFNITLANQTLTWSPNTSVLATASPLTPSVLATGLGSPSISYSVTNAGTTGCTVNSTTGVITYSTAGTCTLRASAAATSQYAATTIDVSFTVSLANQTVTWSPNTTSSNAIDGSLTVSTLASALGSPSISYSVADASTTGCSFNSGTRVLSFSAIGTCVIRATAAASALYASATLDVTFTINLATQTITWSPSSTTGYLGVGTLTVSSLATANGGASISYTVFSDGGTGCSFDSTSRTLSFTALGTCVIRATAAATSMYLGGFVDVTFNLVRSTQTVTWTPITNYYLNQSPKIVSAQASALGSAAVVYSVQSAGVSGCSVNAANATLTWSATGNCVVRATAAQTASYSSAYLDVTFAILPNAQYSVTYDQNASGMSASSTVTYTVGGSALILPTTTRASYIFDGWYTAANGGTKVGDAGASYTPVANGMIYAHWIQESLFGMGTATKIGTITTVAGLGTTYSASSSSTSVQVNYPADALPAGTVIDIYLPSTSSHAQQVISGSNAFVVNLVLAWVAADGTVPSTATGSPIAMTINNPAIKAGAVVYGLLGNQVSNLGTATQDGTITVAITDDPEIVIANVTPQSPTTVTATAADSSATVSWMAPASNGGAVITGYVVTANNGATCTTTGATTCVITGLTNGVDYTFTVVATNAVGSSQASAASLAVTPVGVQVIQPPVVTPVTPVTPVVPPVTPVVPPVTPVTPVTPVVPPVAVITTSAPVTAQFSSGSAVLSSAAKAVIAAKAKALLGKKNLSVTVTGRVAVTGSINLAKARAAAVISYLKSFGLKGTFTIAWAKLSGSSAMSAVIKAKFSN